MGKGDGKKKRKKKPKTAAASGGAKSVSSASSSSSTTTTTPQPLRVTTQINVPIKRQIRYAKLNQQAAKEASTSYRKKKVERTKYRRTWGTLTCFANFRVYTVIFPYFCS